VNSSAKALTAVKSTSSVAKDMIARADNFFIVILLSIKVKVRKGQKPLS
jgi:hypothetical protein